KGILLALDLSLSNSIDIQVGPFANGQLEMAFTRGFVQSQGFVHHFGPNAPFQPQGAARTLLFDTTQQAGTNPAGQHYTFQQEYDWSGYTARERIFGVLNGIVADPTLTLDVFAYDLNEPDIIKIFLQLAGEGRIRLILDNADLHHSTTKPKPEDEVETLFLQAAKSPAAILRGDFGRYAHDKVFIVYKDKVALQVLTGSTNFSVTGMYVNANHVLIFNNTTVAGLYAKVFQEAWNDKVTESFSASSFAQAPFPVNEKGLPKMSITFSPHPAAFASSNLQTISDRVGAEKSSVLFAVMSVSTGGGPVLPALMDLHSNQKVFSYGISDSPGTGISLYKPGNKTGVLVTGKPGAVNLPPPFDQEETVGIGHEIHHKFIVCGFNKPDAVVWCGSSNLALGGEEENGDNLIRIDDSAIATVFAIEAVSLVDHFDFRDSLAKGKASKGKPAPTPGLSDNPPQPTLYLHDDDSWVKRYYDVKDLYCADRLLFCNKA
ncbi:MAG: phospholipase D-like domain-containing protein, partial [Bacteroidota bacterium]